MSTETQTKSQTDRPDKLMYEYLQVRATVVNFTDQTMILTGSDLSWGKWIQSPVDVPKEDSITFASQGRDSSPSGTEGWASWKIGSATITVNFSCPLHGSNSQSITCDSPAFIVSATGTGGDVNTVSYKVKKA